MENGQLTSECTSSNDFVVRLVPDIDNLLLLFGLDA
jgi:hypothetical protein